MENQHKNYYYSFRHVPLIKRSSKLRHVQWRSKHIINATFLTVLAVIVSIRIWKIIATGRIRFGSGMHRRYIELLDAPLYTTAVIFFGLFLISITITYNVLLVNAFSRYLRTPKQFRQFWTWHPSSGQPLFEIPANILLYIIAIPMILLSGHAWDLLLSFSGAALDDPRRPYSGLRLNWFTGYPGTWIAGAITVALFSLYAHARGWWSIRK